MSYAIIKVTKHDGTGYVAWMEDEPGRMREAFHDFIVHGITTELLEYVDEERDPIYGYSYLMTRVMQHQEHHEKG